MREDVQEALECAAGADRLSGMFLAGKATPSAQRISAVRNIVRRFLQNVDEDTTAADLRRELED